MKGRRSRRDEGDTSVRQSHSCDGLVAAAGPAAAKVSLAAFLSKNGGDVGVSLGEDGGSLTSWSSLVKQKSRLSKSVKVNIYHSSVLASWVSPTRGLETSLNTNVL